MKLQLMPLWTIRQYSAHRLLSLFLICAFPVHLWAIILILRDIPWMTQRTNLWDAIGVGAYGLVFAFVESLIVFGIFTLLGFLTPRQWAADKRIAFLSLLVLLLSAWGMISQLFFLWNISIPAAAVQSLAQSGHPLRIMYAVSLAVVLPGIGVPVYLFIRSDKFVRFLQDLIERFSLLTWFYLTLDLLGLVIVILRNIP
jgi:hypothetical protein